MCAADKAMRVDREKTAAYYAGHVSMPCGCEVCRNYYRQIGEAYPALTGYLAKLGADALRPLELIWDDPHAGQVTYMGCQYVVLGSCPADFSQTVDGVPVAVCAAHPDAGVDEPFFVLEFGPVTLKYRE